jgi:citrate lyase beta subunit
VVFFPPNTSNIHDREGLREEAEDAVTSGFDATWRGRER